METSDTVNYQAPSAEDHGPRLHINHIKQMIDNSDFRYSAKETSRN